MKSMPAVGCRNGHHIQIYIAQIHISYDTYQMRFTYIVKHVVLCVLLLCYTCCVICVRCAVGWLVSITQTVWIFFDNDRT